MIGVPDLPTRKGYTSQRSTKIDYFFINPPQNIDINYTMLTLNKYSLSDHFPIALKIHTYYEFLNKPTIVRNYSETIDYKKLN